MLASLRLGRLHLRSTAMRAPRPLMASSNCFRHPNLSRAGVASARHGSELMEQNKDNGALERSCWLVEQMRASPLAPSGEPACSELDVLATDGLSLRTLQLRATAPFSLCKCHAVNVTRASRDPVSSTRTPHSASLPTVFDEHLEASAHEAPYRVNLDVSATLTHDFNARTPLQAVGWVFTRRSRS